MRIWVSLFVAAVVHGFVLGGAALVASREEAQRLAVSNAHLLYVEIVGARPDPIAEQQVVAVAPDHQSTAPVSPTPRLTALQPATRPTPRHVVEVARPSEPARADPLEIPTSTGPAFPASTPIAAEAPSPTITAAAPARNGRAEPESRGATSSPAPPRRTTSVSAIPRYRSNPAPDYPIPSRRRREEGTVLLNVVVNASGLPDAVSVQRSSGYPLLDRAAVATVQHWTFEPARVNAVAMSSTVVVPVRFSLSE